MLGLDTTLRTVGGLLFRKWLSRKWFAHQGRLSQGHLIDGPTRHIGGRMDRMRPGYRVRQTALVSHVIVFMRRFVVTISEYRKRALRLG